MSDWQPIEAGIPDKTIWAWIPQWEMQCVAWHNGYGWWMPTNLSGRISIPEPSHWMPLPEPPEADE